MAKIQNYIYAVFHSGSYRQRYAAFLSVGFPRIPVPESQAAFNSLAALGEELVQWHLLEHSIGDEMADLEPGGRGVPQWFGSDLGRKKVAEKGRELAEMMSGEGKVYINATSGFANVRLPVWQHTIGGYQVLHKWLDGRRKAGRSLSKDDITHWLHVYSALEATQALMQQVDEAIEAHGGWPGAFSQNHPPPDAAILAAEQQTTKNQIKAQKKTANGKPTSVAPVANLALFDVDEDLDAMAAASGAPPRPKARATPADKAAGGDAFTASISDAADWQTMCAIRAVLACEGPLPRQDLIRNVAIKLGFGRAGTQIAKVLDDALRLAVRRGIAVRERATLRLVARNVEEYDRSFLKKHLLGCISGPWWDKADVPLRFVRYLGFSRTGPKIEEAVWSLMQALIRSGLAERNGRVEAARYRKAKTPG